MLERAEHDAVGVVGSIGLGGAGERSRPHELGEGRRWRDRVDQPPLDGLLALDAFDLRGEHVGEVAAHVALVDDPRQPAGAGQHREQRHLGQRHRRGAVVDEEDLVAGQRQLVAAAGGGAIDRGDHDLAALGGHLLDAVARLVGELAEADLVGVRCRGEHLDVRAGAEELVEPTGDDDGLDARMLEAQALQRVVQLDVDAEVVAS